MRERFFRSENKCADLTKSSRRKRAIILAFKGLAYEEDRPLSYVKYKTLSNNDRKQTRLFRKSEPRTRPFVVRQEGVRIKVFRSGYAVRNLRINRCWNIFLALIMLILFLPTLLFLSVLQLLIHGRPIIYSGKRIGLNGKEFNIYKFRTIQSNATDLNENHVLPGRNQIVLPFGTILRASRLDELPQILNVLKGDMNVFGPRPVRESISDELRSLVDNYDDRFFVKPGLTGFVQGLMPHGASMRLRTRFELQLCKTDASIRWEIRFIMLNAIAVFKKIVTESLHNLTVRLTVSGEDRRDHKRMVPSAAQDKVTILAHSQERDFVICDINDEAISIRSHDPLDSGEYTMRFLKHVGKNKVRQAWCSGTIAQKQHTDVRCNAKAPTPHYIYVIRYRAATEYSDYIVKKYFLADSFF